MASLDNEPRIKIDGVDGVWVLLRDTPGRDAGAVCTQELFDKFETSYAHMTDGIIKRYGEVIATRKQWHYVTEEK